jgi:hypothetical protein
MTLQLGVEDAVMSSHQFLTKFVGIVGYQKSKIQANLR